MIIAWKFSDFADPVSFLSNNMNFSETTTGTTTQNFLIKLGDCLSTIQTLLNNKKVGISHGIFKKELDELEILARTNEYDTLFNSPDTTLLAYQKVARKIFDHYETELEKIEAAKIIETPEKDGFLASAQLKRTFDFALEEAVAMEISRNSAVYFVGGGYLPESAIAISLNFHCPIIVLDKNPEAVEISHRVIEKLGIEKNIKTIVADAEEYDFRGAGAVWIAVMAKDKNRIINRIRQTNPAAKIACRTVRGSRTLLYEPVDNNLLEKDFKISEITSSNPETIMHSLILT